MKLTKPNWVKHTDEKDRRSPIFSVSVHPDGTRLATGGLDKKVKIWSTLPILDSEADADDANHKLLCTMSAHTGSVLAVRWAHHGRFLASGSDDTVIVIWGIDPDGGGRVFGSDDVNVENWKALTRLVGHTADIIDLAWSRDDSMMASVGLDKLVWIWDGQTFDRLRKLDQHGDFVKGVTWDPVGNFLATQSDDKTVKIWDTETWTLVHSVAAPFKNSPKSTFFRRLSWSPDGAFIAASNAMNGPVFVAAVIEREEWSSEISFVGHANTIQVAAFNPRLFFARHDPPSRATASSMLALGADDFSISIWRNTMHKPMIVLHDVFNRPLLDLCWATDGYHLYGCSADGTICAVTLEPEELPEIAELEKTDQVLKEYDYTPARRAPVRTLAPPASTMSNGFGPTTSGSHVNVLQPKKGKPKAPQKRRIDLGGPRETGFGPPPSEPFDAFSTAIQPMGSGAGSTARMFEDVHTVLGNGGTSTPGSSLGIKRRRVDLGDGRIPTDTPELREIRAPRVAIPGSSTAGGSGRMMTVPSVQSVVRARGDGLRTLEARNPSDTRGTTKIICSEDEMDLWVDHLPSAAIELVATASTCAVACEDGGLIIYSASGRRLSSYMLDAPCSEMTATRNKIMVLTADCKCHVIDSRSAKSTFPPCSMSHLLRPPDPSTSSTPTSTIDVHGIVVTSTGVPIVITTLPAAYAYDTSQFQWVELFSSWWSDGLPVVKPKDCGSRMPLYEIECEVDKLWDRVRIERDRPEWYEGGMWMSRLETRMRGAELLASQGEYRYWFGEYIQFMGREGSRERAEEVLQDFLGPKYRVEESSWQPRVVGFPKRDLLMAAIGSFVRSPKLSDLGRQYQRELEQIQERADDYT